MIGKTRRERRYGTRFIVGAAIVVSAVLLCCSFVWTFQDRAHDPTSGENAGEKEKIVKSEDEWRECLTPEQYRILREKGTERAFTGKYYNHHGKGVYTCAACGQELFQSTEKYDSGTGWPSFWKPAADGNVAEESDSSLGMKRTEILCSRCGGHLGHVFDDGPAPTGLRYCVNSAALDFSEEPARPGEGKENLEAATFGTGPCGHLSRTASATRRARVSCALRPGSRISSGYS